MSFSSIGSSHSSSCELPYKNASRILMVSAGVGLLLNLTAIGLFSMSRYPQLLKVVKLSSAAKFIKGQDDVIQSIALSMSIFGTGIVLAGYYGFKRSLM